MSRFNILLITYHYPPSSKVGGKRWMHLAREMIEEGYDFHVVTPETRHLENIDASLEVPGTVHRVPVPFQWLTNRRTNFFNRLTSRIWHNLFKMIDRQECWMLPALLKALAVISEHDVGIIIVSGPPFSAFISAMIASLISKVPLVLDYRDPWSDNPGRSFPILWGRRTARFLERLVMRRTSSVVLSTSSMKRDFLKGVGNLFRKDEVFTITNGIRELPMNQAGATIRTYFRTVLYAGKFYGGRSVNMIAPALQEYSERSGPVRVRIAGPRLRKSELEKFRKIAPDVPIDELGWLPYEETLEEMREADVLFLPSGPDHSYAIPFKFFDYLQAGTPMLAIAPADSAVHDIMVEIGCGEFASVDIREDIEKAVFNVLDSPGKYTGSMAGKYLWQHLAARYLRILAAVSNSVGNRSI